jgi:tetratricopeptide (TPR) repeat protein
MDAALKRRELCDSTRGCTSLFSVAVFLCALSIGSGCRDKQVDKGRFYKGFNGYHRPISTTSQLAQRYFDQGIQMLYGFNNGGAIRSFRSATTSDPNCAMAWWGIASACGPNINKETMSPKQSKQAYQASQAALSRIDGCSPVEQALIRAVAARYAWPAPKNRSALDKAYAEAMRETWMAFPEDPDVGALYAESLLDLQPWDLWTHDGQPKERTQEIINVLDAVLNIHPNHPGANHFYIHAVESCPDPSRALAAADRLVNLVPGSGHLVHMPSHIYVRVGRYADAVDVNEQAIAADDAYVSASGELDPDYYSVYYVHHFHMLTYAAMMEGRFNKAMSAARRLGQSVTREFLREHVDVVDGLMSAPLHVMIRFGKWTDILDEPEPEGFRLLSQAQRRYARAIALAALGRPAEAREEMESFNQLSARIPEEWVVGRNGSLDTVKLARQMMLGEILFREGQVDKAFGALAEAADIEDRLLYDEPPGWMHPVRHAWGALLMAVHRFNEAEQVYRDDLKRNVGNGWALIGLEKALLAQEMHDDAHHVALIRRVAWKRADVSPNSSCYCEPSGNPTP